MNAHSLYQTNDISSQPLTAVQTGILQRKCACGTHTVAGNKCDECQKGALQRKSSNNFEQTTVPPVVHEVLNSSGQPLDESAKAFFEPRFAHNFSRIPVSSVSPQLSPSSLKIGEPADVYEQEADRVADSVMREQSSETSTANRGQDGKFGLNHVRVHTGAKAAQSAQAVNALAYTVGNNIVFGAGQFAPATRSGRHLLAHELTHVAQQSGNLSPKIQRQPDNAENGPTSEIGKELNRNKIFKKLPKFARDKILSEIDNAPETITKAVLDKIIDLAPIDTQYKEGLKSAGEAIIKQITGRKPQSTSKCDAVPGYHEGTSSDFKGMCCQGTIESAQACCSKDKFAPNNGLSNCCQPNEFVNAAGKCEKETEIDLSNICVSPGKKDKLGKCCFPPLEVIDGMCVTPPKAEPPPQPLSLKFTIGVIDDYKVNESVLNSRQKPRFEDVKKQIHQFMKTCPASLITIVGFADKPGTEEHNQDLGQRRADYIKFLLQLDLIGINPKGMPPLIFARSEGENNPVDKDAGEKFSAKNRRVEIEFDSMCPPLGSTSLTKPLTDSPSGFKLPKIGDFNL